MSYRINKLFIVAVKHTKYFVFRFPYFNGDRGFYLDTGFSWSPCA